jgi:hypothetical protein
LRSGVGPLAMETMMAVDTHPNPPLRRADYDDVQHVVTTREARQGAVSGRVLTVMLISILAVGIIFAIIWLTKGNVSP